jgi:hypothetical protein
VGQTKLWPARGAQGGAGVGGGGVLAVEQCKTLGREKTL